MPRKGYVYSTVNEYVDDYMTALTEENIPVGIELLISECSKLQSVFLQAECEFLAKENDRLKQEAISVAEQPSGFSQKVLYQKLLQNYGSSTEPEMKETLENIKKQGYAWSYNQNFVTNSTFPADISKQSLYKCRLRAYPIGHFTFYAGCDIC